jgi:hypothetical protein
MNLTQAATSLGVSGRTLLSLSNAARLRPSILWPTVLGSLISAHWKRRLPPGSLSASVAATDTSQYQHRNRMVSNSQQHSEVGSMKRSCTNSESVSEHAMVFFMSNGCTVVCCMDLRWKFL